VHLNQSSSTTNLQQKRWRSSLKVEFVFFVDDKERGSPSKNNFWLKEEDIGVGREFDWQMFMHILKIIYHYFELAM
jgi:hypothetical protein